MNLFFQSQGECCVLNALESRVLTCCTFSTQNESKVKMSFWGQWLRNKPLPPFSSRKIRATSCVGSLLLCLSLLNTLENDIRLLWVLAISSSRHCAKLQRFAIYHEIAE